MKIPEIIKNLIISILVVVCISLIAYSILYNKVSINKIIPESEEYVLNEEMQEVMDSEEDKEIEETVITYKIDAADLKKYEKTKEYNKGKKNPFAQESESTENLNEISNSSSTNSGNGFYEDDGTK